MKKGVIFDLDGTLAESMHVWENADFEISKKYGFTPDEEYWQTVSSSSFLEGAAYIAKRFTDGVSAEQIADELYALALNDYKYNVEMKDGAVELIKKLHNDGMKIAIATSNVEEMTHAVLKRAGVFEYIDAFVYCDEVGKNKAFPDVYLRAAQKMGINADECYIFEDVPYALEGAKASGAEVIAVYDEFSADKESEMRQKSDRYIMSLTEFSY